MWASGLAWWAAAAAAAVSVLSAADKTPPARDANAAALAEEVRGKGWIAYSARGSSGDWDIFLMRPDGSQVRNITSTPAFEEAAPRFSPDGKRMLYRRLPKGTTVSHDKWGFQGSLVIADADGARPAVFGRDGEYPFAAWDPTGKRISCLTPKGIEIVDLAGKQVLRRLDRKGIFQQLFWSPDGKWFCGTANHLGQSWTIARMDAATGQLNAVSTFQNCTPDWFPDSNSVIFSSRPGDQGGYGWTQLWRADGAGRRRSLLYGEDGRHIYGGLISPDGRYVVFSRCGQDGGGSEKSGAPMAMMRLADTPAIGGPSPALRKKHPATKDGPRLDLPVGWEPHWTAAEVGVGR